MNAALISLMFAAGVAGWVWAKLGRRTGQANPNSVFITAAVAGVVAFIFFFTLLKFVFNIG